MPKMTIPVKPVVEPCLECPIHAKCCSRGVEVRPAQRELIESLPLPFPKPWFTHRPVDWGDGSGEHFGTVVTEKGCIFLTEDHRCGIHRYCLEHGLDVTRYKPVDCVSYPFLPEGEQLSEFYPALCGIYFGEPRS